MGGTKHQYLNNMAKVIREWCKSRENWIFAEYVTSKDNRADKGSRVFNLDAEWKLASYAFQEIVKEFGNPSINLFASRINAKCTKYCSWERDLEAFAINAMTINWREDFMYAFLPFSLIYFPKESKRGRFHRYNSGTLLDRATLVSNFQKSSYFLIHYV